MPVTITLSDRTLQHLEDAWHWWADDAKSTPLPGSVRCALEAVQNDLDASEVVACEKCGTLTQAGRDANDTIHICSATPPHDPNCIRVFRHSGPCVFTDCATGGRYIPHDEPIRSATDCVHD